jgi:hypothetical protein
MYGGATITQPYWGGFRVYLGPPNSHFADQNALTARNEMWRVNFVAYQRVSCKLSEWQAWQKCSRSCGVGYQYKHREILRKPFDTKCDALEKKRACNPHSCPGDCVVSEWSDWDKCTKTCGGGYKQRIRTTIKKAAGGGNGCPSLSDLSACNTFPCGGMFTFY